MTTTPGGPGGAPPALPAVPRPAAAAASASESDDDEQSFEWVARFCRAPAHQFFCEVDAYYLQDRFNLHGLGQETPHAQAAFERITDEADGLAGAKGDDASDDESDLEAAARHLYGLIHARYVLTPYGMSKMKRKFVSGAFGQCPRILCQAQPLLPVGLSDVPRTAHVKLFCPACADVYNPRLAQHAAIDGAYFGTTFPHLFLQQYPALRPSRDALDTPSAYVPRIFGFRLASPAHRARFDAALSALSSAH